MKHEPEDERQTTSHDATESAADLSEQLNTDQEREIRVAGVMRAGEAGSVDDGDHEHWTIDVGSDVIGECGHKVGEVVAVRDDYIVVEKGFFMPTDFYIPKSAILRNDDHGLYLNVSKDEALHHGWDVEPGHHIPA